MIITLYLSVITDTGGNGWIGSGDLWARTMETGAVPLVGDEVILYPTDEEGPLGGPHWEVRRRYVDAAGGWHAELSRMVIDPEDAAREHVLRLSGDGNRVYRIWWSDSKNSVADLLVTLRTGGWLPYDEFRAAGHA